MHDSKRASTDGEIADRSVHPFNLIQWLMVSGLVAITLISVVSGITLSRFLTEHMVQRDSIVTAEFVRGVIGEANRKHALQPHHTNVSAMDHLLRQDADSSTAELRAFFELIAAMPDVFHINVYSQKRDVVWSSRPDLVGSHLGANEELTEALSGKAMIETVGGGESDHGQKQDHAMLTGPVKRFIENYIPIWNEQGTKVVAVAEIYKAPESLFAAIDSGRRFVWIGAVLGGLVLFLALFWIARRADRIIRNQGTRLRHQSQMSSNRVAEINERYLRRIGADLHDGPAQLISYALLRLDSLKAIIRSFQPDRTEVEEVAAIREALLEAMGDIRELSAGLTLAKLEEMSPIAVLEEIVHSHKRRTGTSVKVVVDAVPDELSLPLKISVFRFVQEALNNAFRHGGGIDQTVKCGLRGHQLELEVADGGPGFDPDATRGNNGGGLGLIGLRERLESPGATLLIDSRPGEGTRLMMRCHVKSDEVFPYELKRAS